MLEQELTRRIREMWRERPYDDRAVLVAQMLVPLLTVDPAEHAKSSRDYGRGFSDAVRRMREGLDLS